MRINKLRQGHTQHLAHGKDQQDKGKTKCRDKLLLHPGQLFPGFPLLFYQKVLILVCQGFSFKAKTGNGFQYLALADGLRIKNGNTCFCCQVNPHASHTFKT